MRIECWMTHCNVLTVLFVLFWPFCTTSRAEECHPPELDKLASYRIDEGFVVQAVCEDRGRLNALRVHLRRNDGQPGLDDDPDVSMSYQEYEKLLAILQEVKTLGPLIRQGSVGVTTNMRTVFRDWYQNGLVQRSEFTDLTDPDHPEKLVVNFDVFFIRTIEGRIQDMTSSTQIGGQRDFRVRIDDLWYWVAEDAYQGLKIGESAEVKVIGPIE